MDKSGILSTLKQLKYEVALEIANGYENDPTDETTFRSNQRKLEDVISGLEILINYVESI